MTNPAADTSSAAQRSTVGQQATYLQLLHHPKGHDHLLIRIRRQNKNEGSACMCRKTHQAMVFAHSFNPTWFFVHEIRPIWRSHKPLRQAGGNHMFADSGPLDPAKQFLSDSLELPLSFVLALSAYAYQRSVSLVLAN